MSDSIVLPKRDDNSIEDAEKVVVWARQFKGVDAHIVMNYITLGDGTAAPGSLNGVTLQWDHGDELVEETPEDQENVTNMVASRAIHAPAGSRITRTKTGFDIAALEVAE